MSLVFFILAAFLNALMDTLQHHYHTSIFRNMNEKWWNPNESWKYVKLIPITKYRPDAWHLSKSLMIVCLSLASTPNWYMFIIYGILWNIIFNVFYNRILN